jgi:transposase
LPEAYVAPPAVRELREMVRHRATLVAWRSGLKASVHAVLAKQGLHLAVSDLFGVGGRQRLAAAPLDGAYRLHVNALCRLIDALDFEIEAVGGPLRAALAGHVGYQAVRTIPGVGPVLAAVFVAEVGQVHRFASAGHLTSWAGLTPRHRESDAVVHRGRITNQGSSLVRWAAVEAAHNARKAGWLSTTHTGIAERRGRNTATVAVARKQLTLVYYGLRDGHIRVVDQARTAA